MAYYQIFQKALTKANVNKLDSETLVYTKYLIAIAAPASELFNSVSMQRRVDKTLPFTIISSNRPSENGQVIIELGYFSSGDKIDITWIVRAVSKISAIALYIVNDATKEIRKITKDPVKKMERAEDWLDEIKDFELF